MKKGLKDLFLEEDGIGTVEMILILVVLIGTGDLLVIICEINRCLFSRV